MGVWFLSGRSSFGLSRRFALIGAMAFILGQPVPAAAGIGDWWDIYSGAAETEIRRLNKQADVGLAWHQSRRLFEVQEALYFAIHGLKPPQIEALIANLDDPDRTLDDLRLPSKDGRHRLTARETREQLGLPPDGLEREGIGVIRGFDRLVVYHDIERRGLLRFGQDDDSAELLLSTLQQDIRRNPPVPKHIQKADSQVRQHSPFLIKGGRMLWHHGAENEGCKPVLDRLPQTPTIGLCAVYMPTKSRRNERVADCPGDQVGGVFETVHLLNGEESSRSGRWDDCVAKPPVEQSRFRWVSHPDRSDCRKALYDARYALHANGIRNYRITGQYREERKEWSYREDFPKEWSLPPLVLTWNDPWIVKQDSCRLAWDTGGSEDGTYTVGRCTQDRRRNLTYHWQQSRASGRQAASPAVTCGPWRDVGQSVCPYDYFTTRETETGTYKVSGCTQRRQRTVTSHWRQSARPGSQKELVRKTSGRWRDVSGQTVCPYRYFTTGETETGTYTVNGCTQRRQRAVRLHWRQSTRPGSTKQLRSKTHGPWSDVGRPLCPWISWTTTDHEDGTYTANGCMQKRRRVQTKTYRKRSNDNGPGQLETITYGPWFDVGQPYDCPKPVASTTVSTETKRECSQTTQESRHTSAEYTLFTYNRTVTHHWLTYHDGRRERGQPPFTYGDWKRVGRSYGCNPRSGGGGGNSNSGEAVSGRGYDTDGDGVTDSTDPSGGHYGYSDRGVGAEASGGWTGGSFGRGEWSGSGNLGGKGDWSGGFGRGSGVGSSGNRGGDGGWGNNSGGSGGGSDPWGGLR